ncbi:MAG: putative bifunctional diguanylate cyclase/phosphodiesterase [Oscillospiraceae bacterium]
MFNYKELEDMIEQFRTMFDIVKIVDPVLGKEVAVENGEVKILEYCYNILGKNAKCMNCPCIKSLETGKHYEKYESIGNTVYEITSFPAEFTDKNGEVHKCAFDLINFIPRDEFITTIKSHMMVDLTIGIPNLTGLLEYIGKLIGNGSIENYDAMFFNIHNFKFVNNILTYDQGNGVMVNYANQIIKTLECDEMLARMGGDNFVVVVRRENAKKLIKTLEEISVSYTTPDGRTKDFSFGAKIGASHLDGIKVPGEVMHRITVTFQSIKNDKDVQSAYFSMELLGREMKKQEVIRGFDKALADHEFTVYYQPKVEVNSNKIIGAEALVRWFKHGKLVPPGDFIPTLEKEGKICALDYFVLEEVCIMLKKWQDSGRPLVCISSNFSRKHLEDRNFAKKVIAIVDKYGIEHKYIEIELTESEEFSDYGVMSGFVDEFRKNGFKTSIDDFGTGYSTLKMLQRTALDIVKIDRSFIPLSTDYPEKEKSMNILKDMINLTRNLGMKVIAEGVEDKIQLEYIRKMNCDFVQGYVFDKPLPESEFEKRADALYYD